MIVFKKIRVRNIFSYGNAWTEIDLNSHYKTLIVGKNGHGKSAINLDATCFVLFNRAYRNITKPSLVNDINGKQLEVEIYFESKGNDYRVRRGIKPNIFEIYENGDLVDQDAANRDYQEYLETVILGMNYKTFTQISIIGSSNYIPFMQLDTKNRREVIDELLHLSVFSEMSSLLKNDVSENKKYIALNEANLTLSIDRANIQKQYIDTLQKDNLSRIQQIEQEILYIEKDLTTFRAEMKIAVDEYENSIVVEGDESAKLSNLERQLAVVESQKKRLENEIEKIKKYTTCNECGTEIDEKHRLNHILNYTNEVDAAKEQICHLNEEIAILSEVVQKNTEKRAIMSEKRSKMTLFEQKISLQKTSLISKERELSKLRETPNIDTEKVKLKELAKTVVKNTENKKKAIEDKAYLDAMTTLLKDTGIKSTIIKQYVPVINKLVNQYLQTLDFFVHFEFDENFNETIKARQREERKYESFSEGEKQRIDLALLFAWRTIATMNNASNCNLLVMDEVFDKSLDSTGVDSLLNILSTIDRNTNIFVISHRGELMEEIFDRKIEVKKVNNYSVLFQE